MNPLGWRREHQAAALALCLAGALAGTILAWLDSPFRLASSKALSGEWADAPNVFLFWLSHPHLYWPWPVIGAVTAGLAVYGFKLIRTN
jgi:hypothetical protein